MRRAASSKPGFLRLRCLGKGFSRRLAANPGNISVCSGLGGTSSSSTKGGRRFFLQTQQLAHWPHRIQNARDLHLHCNVGMPPIVAHRAPQHTHFSFTLTSHIVLWGNEVELGARAPRHRASVWVLRQVMPNVVLAHAGDQGSLRHHSTTSVLGNVCGVNGSGRALASCLACPAACAR